MRTHFYHDVVKIYPRIHEEQWDMRHAFDKGRSIDCM